MATIFQGKYYYYENINGKEKKVEKTFTDPKKYAEFIKKNPMPSIGSFFGLKSPSKVSVKKALPAKTKKVSKGKKTPQKKLVKKANKKK